MTPDKVVIQHEGTVPDEAYRSRWWGRRTSPPSTDEVIDESVRNFNIYLRDEELLDLFDKLDNARYTEDLEDGDFNMGFQVGFLKQVVNRWRQGYDWREKEAELNSWPHYTTNIEGIDVHFMHAKPAKPTEDTRTLLMVHGWPGSIWEFHKVLPLLTHPEVHGGEVGDAVEVICPSIPGYGWSEAPHRKGFNAIAAARMMNTLMRRLGKTSYFVQGGDWGSLITEHMARMFPASVDGVHHNMVTDAAGNTMALLHRIAITLAPSLFLDDTEMKYYTPIGKLLKMLLMETGYFHIQATKPDTVAIGLNDSPIGLAAYIMEKFSSWSSMDALDSSDGRLLELFDLDDLLTNVMIYWTTASIGSSQRFYKENVDNNDMMVKMNSVPIRVPAGLAMYPGELVFTPRALAAYKYLNIVQVSYMPHGGHFAAFQVPDLFTKDVMQFMNKVKH